MRVDRAPRGNPRRGSVGVGLAASAGARASDLVDELEHPDVARPALLGRRQRLGVAAVPLLVRSLHHAAQATPRGGESQVKRRAGSI